MACSSEFTCPTQKHHHDNHPLPPASGSQICLDQSVSVTERMLVAAIQDDNITFSPVSYPVEQLQFPRVRLFRRFRFAFSSFSLLPPGFPFSPSCWWSLGYRALWTVRRWSSHRLKQKANASGESIIHKHRSKRHLGWGSRQMDDRTLMSKKKVSLERKTKFTEWLKLLYLWTHRPVESIHKDLTASNVHSVPGQSQAQLIRRRCICTWNQEKRSHPQFCPYTDMFLE